METLDSLETADESSGNSGIVKSEDGSPNHGSGRSSPPPNCAICLGRCRNKSFTDSCLHQFCFKCLLTWSRVKTECPLCKQNFKSIIHNVKSNHQYEEYRVQQPQTEDRVDFSDIFNAARRFRYRTTLTLPRRETMAIRQFLLHYPLSALMNELPPRAAPRDRSRHSPADFRRTVYRHNLWARPLPDFTGRFRDCSPEFFRYNDSQVHRLVPWLSRELFYLLNENNGHVTYVLGRIIELLPQHPILSEELRAELHRYLGDRTDHFLHEFHCFASTPYDITGYDRHVQYQTDARLAGAGAAPGGLVSEVLSSSDTDSNDSDIVMVSSSHDAAPPASAGPSRAEQAAHTHTAAANPAYPQPAVIPIETISHSDSDTDSEVMVVGYIKPPHQRTPELVDLLGSDSDVVVQEPDEPAAEPAPPAPAAGPPDALVRFKLSMRQSRSHSPDSLDSYRPSESPVRRSRRVRQPAAAFDEYIPASKLPSSTDDDSDSFPFESTSSSDARTKRKVKRKSKRKYTRGSRSRGRPDGRESRRSKAAKKSTDGDRRTKGKSKNGKDVKSSKVDIPESSLTPETEAAQALDRAGPSGFEDLPLVDKRTKGKSKNGKNVKSSRVDSSEISLLPKALPAPGLDSAETSVFEDSSKRKRNEELAPAFDRAVPSGFKDGSKRKRSVELAPAIDRAGTSDYEDSPKRKSIVELPPACDRAGPSVFEDGPKRKRSNELASAFERAGPSVFEDDSMRKENAEPARALDRAGPSWFEGGSKRKRDTEPAPALDGARPSSLEDWWTRKQNDEQAPALDRVDSSELADGPYRKRSDEQGSRRETRGNKRLKSIVKVMKRDTSAGADSSESRAGHADSSGASCSTIRSKSKLSPELNTAFRSRPGRDSSSSDDNIPLRRAFSKSYTLSRTYVSDFSD